MSGPLRALIVCLAVIAAGACSSSDSADGVDLQELKAEPILETPISGTSGARVAEERGGERPGVTVLMDVTGDWNAVSVDLARAVRSHGWMVESVNCVGTGNDVIAKKLLDDTWVLLESGAGTRGAGIILRIDPQQVPPAEFTVTGPCPAALVTAASS